MPMTIPAKTIIVAMFASSLSSSVFRFLFIVVEFERIGLEFLD